MDSPHITPEARPKSRCPEVQANVSADGGAPVPDKRNTWTNGSYNWYPFRMPRHADSSPEPNDWSLSFPLDEHVSDVGMTGFDFHEKCSRWAAFDFDAISGHAEGVGLPDEELSRIRDLLFTIPFVEIRKSTRGKGLHIYVFFDPENPPATANHDEHAALARAVLAVLSEMIGLDLPAKVDACGGNIWVWSRRATAENEGLSLIKRATEPFQEIPANWRDQLEVIRRKRSRVRAPGLADSEQDAFDALTAAYPQTPLDEKHRQLIAWLPANGYAAIWQPDHHCLHAHTRGLAAAVEALGLEGVFQTISPGANPDQPNCFLFPLPDSAWMVFRFGRSVKEAPTWYTAPNGWVGCKLNVPSDLRTIVRAAGGHEIPGGAFGFSTAADALNFLKQLGVDEALPEWALTRQTTFKVSSDKRHLDGYLEFYVEQDAAKKSEMAGLGWFITGRPRRWSKQFNVEIADRIQPANLGYVLSRYDDSVRSVVSETGDDVGWMIRHSDGEWLDRNKSDVVSYLKGDSCIPPEVDRFLHDAIENSWRQVNEPFADEYLGGRRWNRHGARLAVQPTEADRPMHHPNWDMVLNHCGRGLDEAIAANAWARRNGIYKGGDYLRLWAALLLKHPKHPLPFLFFYSELQGTAKSTFGAALALLFQDERGCAYGDQALVSQQGFNGELDGAILCLVEETDLGSRSERAYNRMKSWVTAPTIQIHPKGQTAYTARNLTHWVQSANKRSYCPIFDGDSRIVVIEAQPLEGKELSWEEELRPLLEEEAADFLRTLFDLTLPAPEGRLWLPVIDTQAKFGAMQEAADREGMKPSVRVDYNALARALFQLLELEERWFGSTQDLIATVPDGPWPKGVGPFGRALHRPELRGALEEMGVSLTYVTQPDNRSFPSLQGTEEFGRHWTDAELFEDEVRVADLLFLLTRSEASGSRRAAGATLAAE